LRGRTQFVADIDMRGMQEVVFVRSTHAHAYIGSISVQPLARGRVFTAADLPHIKPTRVVTQAVGARSPAWPPLATDKVRYVGEAIAACVAPTRTAAEDLAASVTVDYRPLDPVSDMDAAHVGGRALVFWRQCSPHSKPRRSQPHTGPALPRLLELAQTVLILNFGAKQPRC
jgi:carbon-monoxide dehydrogenase large subunit